MLVLLAVVVEEELAGLAQLVQRQQARRKKRKKRHRRRRRRLYRRPASRRCRPHPHPQHPWHHYPPSHLPRNLLPPPLHLLAIACDNDIIKLSPLSKSRRPSLQKLPLILCRTGLPALQETWALGLQPETSPVGKVDGGGGVGGRLRLSGLERLIVGSELRVEGWEGMVGWERHGGVYDGG